MDDYSDVDILLVEDSPNDAEMTMRALKKGRIVNRIEWLRDGAAALDFILCRGEFAKRGPNQPRLILLDVKMPKVTGIEVLRVLKSEPSTKSIPVVMLTSSSQEIDIVQSYDLGVNSYIVKPVDFDKFIEEVSKLGIYWMLVNKSPGHN